MKALMVMFDSLNRHMLEPYGCDWVKTPNFSRLAGRGVTFGCNYVGSMPCMPARRELHTGRYNFLHRSWGPLEPFDDSMPAMLGNAGVRTHLVSDHYHYWEEGGANYHSKYATWEMVRGQEGDPWMADYNRPDFPMPNAGREGLAEARLFQDWVNRAHMPGEKDHPMARTFQLGLDFLERNHGHDRWFLQIENFSPHEPYFVPERFRRMYDYDFSAFNMDWPGYGGDQRGLYRHYRFLNAAYVSMCDDYLGRVLDAMDHHDLWRDTMLIVNTDHGFLLGEHDLWGKCRMPFYDEIARTPLFIWDPGAGVRNVRRTALTQTIDLAPTLLDFFGAAPTPDMQGRSIRPAVKSGAVVRDAGLFGYHGGYVNVTDGRYVYMRAPVDYAKPLCQYTHMPAHMRSPFPVEEMRRMEMAPPFSFTKGCPVMKIRMEERSPWTNAREFGTLLFDTQSDPAQERPLKDPLIEKRMEDLLRERMLQGDAPPELYDRIGIRR